MDFELSNDQKMLVETAQTFVKKESPIGRARKLREETPVIILDFHAATTAETQTMLHHASGYVSAVIGSARSSSSRPTRTSVRTMRPSVSRRIRTWSTNC